MRTRIISAFPGVGKTHYHKLYPNTTLDSDSSQFSWINLGSVKKMRNPIFPKNYIDHIRENIGKYEIIFVSTHKEVRDALFDNCLFFYLMYPHSSEKDKYLQRYKDRGSPQSFIDLVNENWDVWVDELAACGAGCNRIVVTMPIVNEIEHILSLS